MRKLIFVTGEYYHIYNRGVDRRNIFIDDSDYFRFLHGIKDFRLEAGCFKDRPPFVDDVCYCLMPNHFHLIVRQLKSAGVSKFMHRLGIAYTNYFNFKYERSGVLFQGAFKAKYIENDSYALHLSRYIHLNPKELIDNDRVGSWEFIKNYRWSSFSFYLNGEKPCLISLKKEFIFNHFKDSQEYCDFVFAEDGNLLEDDLKIDV